MVWAVTVIETSQRTLRAALSESNGLGDASSSGWAGAFAALGNSLGIPAVSLLSKLMYVFIPTLRGPKNNVYDFSQSSSSSMSLSSHTFTFCPPQ